MLEEIKAKWDEILFKYQRRTRYFRGVLPHMAAAADPGFCG